MTVRLPRVDSQTAKGICTSPTGEARWGLMTENGSYIMTNYSANHFSPLSFSPVGERLVTLVLSKTDGDRFLRFCQRQSPVFPFCKFTFFLATIEKNYVT